MGLILSGRRQGDEREMVREGTKGGKTRKKVEKENERQSESTAGKE